MIISPFLDDRKRRTLSKIEPGGRATKTGFRPVCAGFDGLLRSSTSLIAAERTGRRCSGIELDPASVDTTIRRWQALIGASTRHAASGRSFDDFAREAEAANAR